ncbi:MAG TPA: hypothetical protein VJJ48_01105 [Candidatus Paceibacterota bacterium]
MFVTSLSLFILSGLTIALLTLAKRFELKGRKAVFLLRTISRGDDRAKDLHHKFLHFYAVGKDKLVFFLLKSLPMKLKKKALVVLAHIGEKGEKYFGNMRNSRLIRREEGLSQFFKNIGEVEKGNGEIHDVGFMIEDLRIEQEPEPLIVLEKPKRKRAPRKKKVVVNYL